MTRKAAIQLAAALAMAALAAWNFLRPSDSRRINLAPYLALGTVAAEETSRLLGGTGDIGLVIPDEGDASDPVMDAQVKAFKAGLAAVGKARVARVSKVAIDGFTAVRTGGAIAPERMPALLSSLPGAAAVVFFVGVPMDEPSLRAKDARGNAKVIVVSPPFPWYDDLVQQRLVDLAIVSRPAPPANAAPPAHGASSIRATFDREYEVLRPRPLGAVTGAVSRPGPAS